MSQGVLPFKYEEEKTQTSSEWAEVCLVPKELCFSINEPAYRYLAKRQVLEEQSCLPGMDDPELPLPFPTMQMEEKRYKVFGYCDQYSDRASVLDTDNCIQS